LPPPKKDYLNQIGPTEHAILDQVLTCSAIGSPKTVAKQLSDFIARTEADEVIVTCAMFDHAARLRSYEIAAQVAGTSSPKRF
jgi:alkanesulfonate monooxygenase SsuD/methylene tetrahydromethanopterin reductase-like flavin-dependent oxidoreductase (luciferase family)